MSKSDPAAKKNLKKDKPAAKTAKKTTPLKKKAAAKKKVAPAKKSNLALVIGTFAAVPYVHLHLESRKRYYPSVPLLVHDDCSHKSEQLKELCDEYGVEFVSSSSRSIQSLGDIRAFLSGLKWAKSIGSKILVKMSRRFIPVADWTAELEELEKTGHHTFSNITRSFNFGFRTECVGLRIADWENNFDKIEETINRNESIFVEGYIHNLARDLNQSNEAAQQYDRENGRTPDINAYAVWKFMGDDRCKQHPDFLWHNCHSPEDYKKLSDEYGLGYSIEDFADPNAGAGAN